MRHAHAMQHPGFLAMAGPHRHRGRGPRGGGWGGPWGGPGFGGPPFGRGPRARRGDVRAALLVLLDEEPRNGYQLIQEIEARSSGMWKPSPGSVYPALSQLEDEGLVRAAETDGRREFLLTDEGRAHVEANRDALGAPWDAVTGGIDQGAVNLREALGQLAAAAMMVARAGSEAQQEEARRILADARRSLYRLLAEEDPEDAAK